MYSINGYLFASRSGGGAGGGAGCVGEVGGSEGVGGVGSGSGHLCIMTSIYFYDTYDFRSTDF